MVRIVIFCVLLVVLARISTVSAVRLTESGSTLMYPLATTWAQSWPGNAKVALDTNGTGSAQGVSDVIGGTAQLGMSDAYTLDAPDAVPLLEIPLAVGGVQVSYNVPEAAGTHLRLSGELLAKIYSGSIRFWDDPAIRAANPQLSRPLPHRAIVVYHRSDGSGTTFVFTQFLSASSAPWRTGPGFGDRVRWPAGPWSREVVGNAGVLLGCEVQPYSLGYIGVSYRSRGDAVHLGYAAIRNAAGAYVLPTPETLRAAADAQLPVTSDAARVSLIDAPGAASYPIANYEYAVVRERQPDTKTAGAVSTFLLWAVSSDGGNAGSFLSPVNFSPLPEAVRANAVREIRAIGS